MSEADWSRYLTVDCPFKNICRDYPKFCNQCENNRAKRSFFKPRRWGAYEHYTRR